MRAIILLAIVLVPFLTYSKGKMAIYIDPSDIKEDYIPVVVVDNGSKKDGNVYLAYSEEFQFIFTQENKLYLDMGAALSNTQPGFTMQFSCEKSNLSLCEDYAKFEIYYDFYRSELQVSYIQRNVDYGEIETDPLLIVSNTVNYSYSSARNGSNTSIFGQWLAGIDYGITNNSSLHTGLRYNFSTQSLEPEHAEVEHRTRDNSFGLFYRNQADDLTRIGSAGRYGVYYRDQMTGVSVISSGQRETISVTTNSDGNINLLDKFGQLKQTARAVRGINYIDVDSQKFADGAVTVNVIENGVQVDSFERFLSAGVAGKGTSLSELSLGYAYSDNAALSQQPFMEVKSRLAGMSVNLGAMAQTGYYMDLNYSSSNRWQWGGRVFRKQDGDDFDTRVSYNHSINGWTISPSFMYQSTPKGESTYAYIGMSGSISDYVVNTTYSNRYTWGATGSSKVQNSIDLGISSTLYTDYAKIRWSTYITAGSDDQYNIGLNLTLFPASSETRVVPTLNVNYSGDKFNARAVAETKINESLTVSPEVSFSHVGMDGAGMLTQFNTDKIRSDIGMYRNADTDSLNANLYSVVYASPDSLSLASTKYNSQFVFANTKSDAVVKSSADLSINGRQRKILGEHIELINTEPNGQPSTIYSLTDRSVVDGDYERFSMPSFRSKKITVRSYTDRLFVRGRIISKGKPVGGAMVVNHIDKTKSDQDGYFYLNVSRTAPTIAVFNSDQKCTELTINDKSMRINNEVFVGRLECSA